MADSYTIGTSTIPMVKVPFASNDQQKVTDISFLKTGITRPMVTPTESGGIRFTRSQLNGIGYFATLGAYLDRIGYPYGKERDTAQELGGYPKGAILISEDDDYVREYVSKEENNVWPLPTEAQDGTYEGNEHWGVTLPPIVDFFPDFSTYTNKFSSGISGEGTIAYTVDEDGWYSMACLYTGYKWENQPEYNNALYQASCVVLVANTMIARLDGKQSIRLTPDGWDRDVGVVTTTVPLKKGNVLKFSYRLKIGEQYLYDGRIEVKRWGVSSL